jgi:hypothetical protein
MTIASSVENLVIIMSSVRALSHETAYSPLNNSYYKDYG